jgi:exopolysaccharide biosynthesis polyprenyl glycosylphosphotransferase
MTQRRTVAPEAVRSTVGGSPALEVAPALPPEQVAWPRTVWVSVVLMLGLLASLSTYVVAATPPAPVAALLAPVVLLGGTATRVLFEALFGASRDKHGRLALTALASTAVGQGLVAVSMVVVGIPPTAPALVAGSSATFTILSAAGVARRLELRYWGAARRVFFVGPPDQARDLGSEIASRGDLRLAGALTVSAAGPPRDRRAIEAAILDARPTTLVISPDAARNPEVVGAASGLHARGLRVRELVSFYEAQFGKVPLSALTPSWFLFDVAEIHRPRVYGAVKRAIDLTAATAVLLLALPLFALIAAAVRIDSAGPALFRQPRVGKEGSTFKLIKFRTMDLSNPPVPAWGTEHRHRITRIGRFLRRFRLDELPQLWNVLRGDLSLVGPRAEQPEIVERLGEVFEFYSVRHHVRPGVTGWAQINYGYGGSLEGVREKLQYDFFYMKRQSLRLDLLILASTIRTVIAGTGR